MTHRFKLEGCMCFHENHGHKVFVRHDKLMAKKPCFPPTEHGSVFSQEPMKPDRLYEVRLRDVNERYDVTCFGVVTQHPILYCPSRDYVSDPSVLYIDCDGIWLFGTWVKYRRDFLRRLPRRSRVGLALEENRTLHLFLDDEPMGPVAHNIPDPCYFYFDLYLRCESIYALPIKVLERK